MQHVFAAGVRWAFDVIGIPKRHGRIQKASEGNKQLTSEALRVLQVGSVGYPAFWLQMIGYDQEFYRRARAEGVPTGVNL